MFVRCACGMVMAAAARELWIDTWARAVTVKTVGAHTGLSPGNHARLVGEDAGELRIDAWARALTVKTFWARTGLRPGLMRVWSGHTPGNDWAVGGGTRGR